MELEDYTNQEFYHSVELTRQKCCVQVHLLGAGGISLRAVENDPSSRLDSRVPPRNDGIHLISLYN